MTTWKTSKPDPIREACRVIWGNFADLPLQEQTELRARFEDALEAYAATFSIYLQCEVEGCTNLAACCWSDTLKYRVTCSKHRRTEHEHQ